MSSLSLPSMADKLASGFAQRLWQGVCERMIRKHEVITQRDVAAAITRATGRYTDARLVNDWLRKGKVPRDDRLVPVAKYLDLDPGWLRYGTGAPRPFPHDYPIPRGVKLRNIENDDDGGPSPQPKSRKTPAKGAHARDGDHHRRAS